MKMQSTIVDSNSLEGFHVENESTRKSDFANENGSSLNLVEALEPEDQCSYSLQKSAHKIDNDPWYQVGLLLVTSFNCVYILGFSNLILVPFGLVWGIISMVVIGRKMYYLSWALQFVHFILCNMGFLLLSGKALKDIFMDHNRMVGLKLPEFIMISGVTYFIFAFSVPHLSAMGTWFGISAFLTFVYVAIAMIVSITDGSSRSKDYHVPGTEQQKVFNVLGAIAALVFANNSGMLPEIQATLKHPAIKNMRKALYLQYSVGMAIYYAVAIIGYCAYGSSVSDYLLNDLSGPKWAKVLANTTAFLQTVVSQHIFCVPVHEALDTRFYRLDEHENSLYNLSTRFILRALFFAINTLCAAMFPFLGDFVTLVGSLSLIPLTFVFPSLVFLKVNRHSSSVWQKSWHTFTVVFFALVTLATTASALRLIITNAKTYRLFADA